MSERLAIKLAKERSLEDQQQQQHTPQGSIPPNNNNNTTNALLSEVTPTEGNERILNVQKYIRGGGGFNMEHTIAKALPPGSPPSLLFPQQDIGVRWVDDTDNGYSYYLGTIVCSKIDNGVVVHKIEYEDGETHWENLHMSGYIYCDGDDWIVVDPHTEFISLEQSNDDDEQEEDSSSGDEDNRSKSDDSDFIDDGPLGSTDENNNTSNKRHSTERPTTSEAKRSTGAKQSKRSKNSADDADDGVSTVNKKVTFGTVVQATKDMGKKAANKLSKVVGKVQKGKYKATGTKNIRQYTSSRGKTTYLCQIKILNKDCSIGTFQTMEEAEAAINIARDVLGIVGEANTVPPSSIKGSNKEKATKEMVKRVKEAIEKEGLKATKSNEVRVNGMTLPGRGKYIYELERMDGSVVYVTQVKFGGSSWNIGTYDTMESANKAYGLAFEELRDKDVPDDKNAVKAIVRRAKQVVGYGMCDNEYHGKVAAAFEKSKVTPSIMDALPDGKDKNQIKSLYGSDVQTSFHATAVACSSLLDKFPGLTEEIIGGDSDLAKEFSEENGCMTDILTAKMRDHGVCSRIIPTRLLGEIDLFQLLRNAIDEFGNIFSISPSEQVPDTVSQSDSDYVIKIECSSETDLLSALAHVWGVDSIKAFLTIYTSADGFEVEIDEKDNQEKVYYLTHFEMDSGCNTPICKLPSQRVDTEKERELIEVKRELIVVKRELIEGKREMAKMKREMAEMKQMMIEFQSMLRSHAQTKNLVREEDQVFTI